MAQYSLKQQIQTFNEQIHVFEHERYNDLEAIINIIESLNPTALKNYANHLRANLTGIMQAESLDELALYQNSFNEVLNTLMIDEDVLGIYPCILHYQQVIDLSHASFEDDLEQDQEIRDFKINTRLEWINIGIKEFQKNIYELKLELKNRIDNTTDNLKNNLIKKNIAQQKITGLEAALKKIEQIEKDMVSALPLAKEMMLANTREDFDKKRKIIADQLRSIQKLGGTNEGRKDLQNHFINMGQSQVEALYEARATYLPRPTGSLRKAIDFGWIVLGAALVAVGVILFAPVVVLALGLVGLGYGAIDLAKEVTEPIATHHMPKLGKHPIIKPEIKLEISTEEKVKNTIKKGVPIVLSALALIAGIMAFAFPPLGIPMAIIGFGLALIGAAMFGKNWYQEKQYFKKITAKHTDIQNQYRTRTSLLEEKEVEKEVEKETETEKESDIDKMGQAWVRPIHSEAKIDLFLLKHKLDYPLSKEEIKKLAPHQTQENNISINNLSIENIENKKTEGEKKENNNENNGKHDPNLHH